MYFCVVDTNKKILVIQQKMIGDVLASSIICEALKNKYPKSQIHYLVHKPTLAVVVENSFIDKIISYPPPTFKNIFYLLKLIISLRAQKYDWVIDAYGKTESTFIALLSGSKKRTSYYKKYTNIFYTETVKRSPVIYTPMGNALEDRLRLVLKECEIKEKLYKPKIFLSQIEKQNAKLFLERKNINLNHPLYMVSLLGSSKNKSLPTHTMAGILEIIAQQPNAQIIFNYIPFQKQEALEIINKVSKKYSSQLYFEAYASSLRDFLGILYYCKALIGNEGGAVNMAKALNIPTFTVFSPWISKNAWAMFEDNYVNVSLHLSDFEPELYKQKKPKEFKHKSESLYQKLTLKRIEKPLQSFLKYLNK